jgi:hypothetical protein
VLFAGGRRKVRGAVRIAAPHRFRCYTKSRQSIFAARPDSSFCSDFARRAGEFSSKQIEVTSSERPASRILDSTLDSCDVQKGLNFMPAVYIGEANPTGFLHRGGIGRGCGAGRGLGVTLGVEVADGLAVADGVGVAVAVTVGVGVGVGDSVGLSSQVSLKYPLLS